MDVLKDCGNDQALNDEISQLNININNGEVLENSCNSSHAQDKFDAESYLRDLCPKSTHEEIFKFLNMDINSHSGNSEEDMYLIAQDDGKMYIANDVGLDKLDIESASLDDYNLKDDIISEFVNNDQNIDPKDLHYSLNSSSVKRSAEFSPKSLSPHSYSSSVQLHNSYAQYSSERTSGSDAETMPMVETSIVNQGNNNSHIDPLDLHESSQVRKYVKEKAEGSDKYQNHTGYNYYYYFENSLDYLSEIRFKPTKLVTELRMEDLIDAICQGPKFSTIMLLKTNKIIQRQKIDTRIDYYCYQASIRLIDRPDCLKDKNQFTNNEAYLALFYLFEIMNQYKKSTELPQVKKLVQDNLEGHFQDEYKKYNCMGENIYSVWKRFESESLLNIKGIKPKWWCMLGGLDIRLITDIMNRITNPKFKNILKS